VASIITYRDLEAWQVAMDFVERCYAVTAKFPSNEQYGLTSQLRRAVVSIPTNIAEGQRRRKPKIYANHVNIALGSHGEVETCIEIAWRLRLISSDDKTILCRYSESTGRLLNGLYRAVRSKLRDKSDQ
jgi:four helix bundle protein